jgi:hypothetical protein
MQRFFSAASQNRDPGYFEAQITGTPALQRTVPQVLHAALRPGHASDSSPRMKEIIPPHCRESSYRIERIRDPRFNINATNARRPAMPEQKTYTGGCHCGMVRFECTSDLAMVTACNCSICTKKGLHFTFLAPESFQLRAGEDNLKEYLFNKHAIRHQLCIDCGVDVFARGKKPDGAEVVAVNVSCIDGIELAKLQMTPIDGRNR